MSSRGKKKGMVGVVQRHLHMLPMIKANRPPAIKAQARAEEALAATRARDSRHELADRKRKAAKQARKRQRKTK